MGGLAIIGLLREHGWVLNLVLIALGAYFVAGAANAVVGRAIRVVPTAADVGAKSGAARPRAHGAPSNEKLASIAARNLFGALQENLSPINAEAEGEEQESLVSGREYKYEDLKKCTIPGAVRATLVAEDAPEWSMAVVYLNSDRETQIFNINDGSNAIASDAVLVDVLSREIVVRRRDHFELCKAEDEGQATTVRARPRPTPGAGSEEEPSGEISKTGDDKYTIDGSYIDETLSNLSQIATQARIVPSFKSGKANGFKLFSIKPGSIYSKIGLQNGDVIQKVNGYEINSPDKALELYQKLRDAQNVSLEILRRGQPKTFGYEIAR